jgi:ubiquinone/menaquinone biosynthesis C-methylase UbiE
MPKGWEWDESLFRGSAPYYLRGRLPYAPGLAEALASTLSLDGRGRLIDVGCGPGILALLLARLFEEVIGLDPDPGMLAEARDRAVTAGLRHARWLQLRAEELPAGLGIFRVATFGQSFHWMDRPRVAATVREMLEPGGAFVQIADVKEPVVTPETGLPYPEPPYEAIQGLVRGYLGPVQRAGRGVLRYGTPGDEATVLKEAGFGDPVRVRVPAGNVLVRTADDLVAWAFSRSGSAPHLFEERLEDFERDLRRMLDDVSPSGRFAEVQSDTEVFVWRKQSRE